MCLYIHQERGTNHKDKGRIKNKERDKFADRREDIQIHRKEVFRERCTDKPTSTWAVGLNVMRATGGVRRKSVLLASGLLMCGFALSGCLLSLSLSLSQERTGCTPMLSCFLSIFLGGRPASHFAKRSPCFVICGQGDNLSHRSTRKT